MDAYSFNAWRHYMDLFIPFIATVEPANSVSDSSSSKLNYNNISVPANSTFQKVYFEELTRKCYEENGDFEKISSIARIHYEEYYGAGSSRLKRWKLYFSKYGIVINIEENNGSLSIKAA